MESNLIEFIDLLEDDEKEEKNKIYIDKINSLKNAFTSINDVIQAITKFEEVKPLKDASILMLKIVNKL